jgi:hypothetical protein
MRKLLISTKNNLIIILFCIGITLVGIGSKWSMIEKYGSTVHYHDAWGGDAIQGIIPYLEDELSLKDLFWEPHCEHRIGITRLCSIIITSINGQWDNKVKTSLYAFIHILFFILIILKYRKILTNIYSWMLPLIISFCLTCPSSFENTLNSFQIQFYMNLITSLIIIHYLTKNFLRKQQYLILIITILISIFNMSSTVFPLSSIIIFNIYLLLRDRKFTKLIIRNLLICASFLIFAIFAINHVEEHEDLHAKGLFEFAQMLSEILAFPFGSKTILLNLLFLSIFNLPIFLYLWFFVSGRYDYKEIHNNKNTICLVICFFLQIIALCYARNSYSIPSRYYDIFVVLIILNCICIKSLHLDFKFLKNKNVIFLWFILISLGFIKRYLKSDQTLMSDYRENVEFHLEEYSQDKNQTKYLKLPPEVIPYPHPSPILHVMNNAQIKELLPPPIGKKVNFDNGKLIRSMSIEKKLTTQERLTRYYTLEGKNKIYESNFIKYNDSSNILRLCYKADPNLNPKCIKITNQNGYISFLSTKKFKGLWQNSHFFLPNDTISLKLSINLGSDSSWFMFQDLEKVTPTSWTLRQIRKSSINIFLAGVFLILIPIVFMHKKNEAH